MPPWVLPFALVLASFGFRLPALMNAPGTDADAAVVGLQAMHLLRGEHAALLWGSAYQTSLDSYVAAGFFAVLGPTPLALMLSTLVGHVVLTLLAFALLRPHLGERRAFVLCSILVFTTSPVHTYVLYPPRQAALTVAMGAFLALDRAGARRWLTALGGLLGTFAVFADPYAWLFVPGVVLFAVGCALDDGREGAVRRFAPAAVGLAVGLVPYALLMRHPHASTGTLGMDAARVVANGKLLFADALPWLFGVHVYTARHALEYGLLERPAVVTLAAALAALVVGVAALSSFVFALRRATPWPLRRIGAAGGVVVVATVLGFLPSVMVMDRFSARYLAAIVLALPLALAPLAERLSLRALVGWLAPFLIATGTGGWLGFSPFVKGFAPRVVASGQREADMQAALLSSGVEAAMADYWVSYRLTFLFRESPPVVPLHPQEDRYAPYRERFERAAVRAYLFDPFRSRETPEQAHAEAERLGTITEVVRIDGVTAYIVKR